MTKTIESRLRLTLIRILTAPTPDDLWQLQADLLVLDEKSGLTAPKATAHNVAGEFYSYLRDLESKRGSRSASRWGAVLATAAVSSVGLQELITAHKDPLKRLMDIGVTAALEVGSALKHVLAWEMEAALMYYDVALYLHTQLWQISEITRPELSPQARKAYLNQLLEPVLDPDATEDTKSAILTQLFQTVLAARMQPLLD